MATGEGLAASAAAAAAEEEGRRGEEGREQEAEELESEAGSFSTRRCFDGANRRRRPSGSCPFRIPSPARC